MNKNEIIKKLRDMAKYPTVTLPRDCEALKAAADLLAQPEQEPVAWVNQANLNSAAIERSRGGRGDTHTWSETPNDYHQIPLYTTTPHRKPLTDEDLRKLADKHLFYQPEGYEVSGVFTLARAIEAAHGIKGEA